MPRIRTLKPEILEDKNTAGLSDSAFRLLVGMIVLADDYGNIRAEEEWLQGQIWWLHKIPPRIQNLLAELHSAPLIEVYEVRKQLYAHILGWEKHQRINNAGKPRVPLPSDGTTYFAAGFNDDHPRNSAKLSSSPNFAAGPRSLDHDHRSLEPDHDPEQGVGAGRALPALAGSIESEPDPWDPEPAKPKRKSRAKSARGPGRPPKPDRPHVERWHEVMDAYWVAFERANGSKPNPHPRTLAELRERVVQAGADEVIRRIEIMFSDPPAWPAGPHDLTNLVGQYFDRFATPGSKAPRAKQANRGSVIDTAPTDPVKYYEPNDWQKSLGPEWQPKDPETERREIDAWYADRDARDAAAKLPVEVPKTVMPDGSIRVGFTR